MSRLPDQEEHDLVRIDEKDAWDEFLPEGSNELQRLATELEGQSSASPSSPADDRPPVEGLWKVPPAAGVEHAQIREPVAPLSPPDEPRRALGRFTRPLSDLETPLVLEPEPVRVPEPLTRPRAHFETPSIPQPTSPPAEPVVPPAPPAPATARVAVGSRTVPAPPDARTRERQDTSKRTFEGISLAQVLAHHVPVQWPEAVATIEELCAVLVHQAPSAPVPTLQHVLITPAGEVHVVPGSKGRRDTATVGRLLHSLLANTATPLPLRLFVTSSIASSRYESIGLYAEALSDYALPNRAELIGELCKRALETHGAGRQALPVALGSRESRDTRPRTQETRGPRRWLWIAAGGGVILALAAAAVVGYDAQFPASGVSSAILSPVSAAITGGEETATQSVARVGRDLWAPGAIGPFETQQAAPPRTAREPDVLSDARPGRLQSFEVPVPELERVPDVQDATGGAAPFQPAQPSPAERPPAVAPPVAMAPERSGNVLESRSRPSPDRVYTSDDTDVVPPSLASSGRNLLPPALPGSSPRPVFELIIDEGGAVKTATVVGGSQRWDDMMMLSSLKNQRYRPATKDGVAVQYRLRIQP